MTNNNYNPDVLNCIANLSNDEVFTPPELANKMLDLLPQELFRSSNTTFLDPFTKSGVFLREIVKRLDRGLAEEIPDRQKRIDHILHHQVFGIACTELTSLLARRSVYCSKTANGQYSISKFDTPEGNILYKNIKHTWVNGKCKYCGASQSVYDRGSEAEQYAYMFIHTDNPKQFFKNMKFDVIIGNPPYQLDDGGAQASAVPIYNKFVIQAKQLNPRYLCAITPSRWFAGGRGLDTYREEMLHDSRIRIIVDYFNSTDCFPGIDLSGGVSYFLWNRDSTGDCMITSFINKQVTTLKRPLLEDNSPTFIRFNQAISIVRKVGEMPNGSFSKIVSSQKPFGLRTYVQGESKNKERNILLYSNKNADMKGEGYVSLSEIPIHREWIKKYKVFISRAYGERGEFPYLVIGKPFIGKPDSCCTETYLSIGPFENAFRQRMLYLICKRVSLDFLFY